MSCYLASPLFDGWSFSPPNFTGWTFNPPDMPGVYSTYDGNYTATISTNISISSLALVTVTLLCTTTQPSDFSVRILSDSYSYLLEPCPQNLIGNVTADLGYHGKGIWPLTLDIQVTQGNEQLDQFLVIGDIQITACSLPLDYLGWMIPLIVIPPLAVVLLIWYRRLRRRSKFIALTEFERSKFIASTRVDEIS